MLQVIFFMLNKIEKKKFLLLCYISAQLSAL